MIDIQIALIVGLALTVLLLALVARTQPAKRPLLRRGIARATLVSILVGLVIGVVVTFTFTGREFLDSTVEFPGALLLGLVLATTAAGAFLWLATLLLAVGLWWRGGSGWASYGALIAVPMVAAAVIFGYSILQLLQADAESPTVRVGSASLVLEGGRLGRATASGSATCILWPEGSFGLEAGFDPQQHFVTADGRSASVQLGLATDGAVELLAMSVGEVGATPGKGWQPGPETTRPSPGSTAAAGEVALSGIVPLTGSGEPDPDERWQGSLTWDCP